MRLDFTSNVGIQTTVFSLRYNVEGYIDFIAAHIKGRYQEQRRVTTALEWLSLSPPLPFNFPKALNNNRRHLL